MKSKSKRGFTLIETIIAMLILAAGLVLLTNALGGSFMRMRKIQLINEVGVLLERKVTELKLEYKDKPIAEIPEEREEDFGSEYPQYSWQMTSRELELPDISAALTARAGGADEMLLTIIKQMTEMITKSVKEVTVTVIYKSQPRDLKFSVTTYFVDYNAANFGMPSPGGG